MASSFTAGIPQPIPSGSPGVALRGGRRRSIAPRHPRSLGKRRQVNNRRCGVAARASHASPRANHRGQSIKRFGSVRQGTEGTTMKTRHGRISMTAIGALCGIMVLLVAGTGEAGSGDYGKLAAEWWKWTYSIPCTTALCPNPVFDTTGGYGAVGQHGEVWFLAGTFGGTVTRNVSVPEGSQIFFPVVNNAFFNSPNTCGQGPESLSVEEGRAAIAPFIDAAINLSATLDGKPLKIVREQSVVFGVALPKDNLFDFLGFPCTPGIYSPA